jgi:hypothetical protein
VNVLIPILAGVVVTLLLFFQLGVWEKNILTNNLFAILIASVLMTPIAFLFKRSGILVVFSLIMILDIYLVWNSGQSALSPGKNWYIAMIQSDLMRHWPVPLALVTQTRMLGLGDVCFTIFGMIFAYREFNKLTAIAFTILATAPILLLPLAHQYFPDLPSFFPYTIFIAPWALLLVLASFVREKYFRTSPADN